MLNYFRSWRRKLGVMTLVMALLFVGGWVRSLTYCDHLIIAYPQRFSDSETLTSERGQVIWWASNWSGNWPDDKWMVKADSWELGDSPFVEMYSDEMPPFLRSWTGIRIMLEGTRLAVSYWSFIIPLTLLAAFLLLSKPRVAKPPAATEK